MDTILQTPSCPVAITSGFVEKGETTIIMECHDAIFQHVTVVNEEGDTLFVGEGKGLFQSWSWRRKIKDASGNHLFDVRKVMDGMIRYKWVIDSPSGLELASLRHNSHSQREALNMLVRNESGVEMMVEVRPKDEGAVTTLVNIEELPVAEIRVAEFNFARNPKKDSAGLRARVAGGVDLSLVVAIMMCRAEMLPV